MGPHVEEPVYSDKIWQSLLPHFSKVGLTLTVTSKKATIPTSHSLHLMTEALMDSKSELLSKFDIFVTVYMSQRV